MDAHVDLTSFGNVQNFGHDHFPYLYLTQCRRYLRHYTIIDFHGGEFRSIFNVTWWMIFRSILSVIFRVILSSILRVKNGYITVSIKDNIQDGIKVNNKGYKLLKYILMSIHVIMRSIRTSH